jgi:hypothetical protein
MARMYRRYPVMKSVEGVRFEKKEDYSLAAESIEKACPCPLTPGRI